MLVRTRDALAFWTFTTPLTIVLAWYPYAPWIGLLASVAMMKNGKSKKFEKQWLNWFEIAKAVGALAGVTAITAFQMQSFPYSTGWHNIFSTLLVVNILEAIIRDVQSGTGHLPNALAGFFLLLLIPDSHLFAEFRDTSSSVGLLFFPLKKKWIILYTSWNAAFSFGFNFSWSTRLMLITAILASVICGNQAYWLHMRCISLTLNMLLRATRATYLYQPGCSFVTNRERAQHSVPVRAVWGGCNLALCIQYFLENS